MLARSVLGLLMPLLLAVSIACDFDSSTLDQVAHSSADLEPLPTWFDGLPTGVQSSLLWVADHEEGNLGDWTFDGSRQAGGGMFNTGGPQVSARVIREMAHSGTYSLEARITNAIRSENGDRAIRLMRWTEAPWHAGGQYFPPEAYFSVWMYLPQSYDPNKHEPWDPGDGGWWNVFQFKSDDADNESQPLWVLNIDHDEGTGEMYFRLYSKYNDPSSRGQADRIPIPVRQWVHVEAFYAQDSEGEGSILVWQDGVKILGAEDVVTKLAGAARWGIGNYTDHIAGGDQVGSAVILFDDAAVSTVPLHSYR